ncbi:CDP-6-deoxy-delta-3,4-glucoseen reductase [Caballeronia sp. TF1N1]|uniref:CDP-6-deoxy-delta-3,4-glucoseen reductase n=1 Tax=Caballeronia sp. TF1N1 TaxID=2878153 RepID=UPI001FD556FE|nr:CDP-6-deoxy-delta-3,4-glucoseen reductase [Caballeronia sp. TF1N1]
MAYQVTIQQSGRQFEVELGETVLNAALRKSVPLPHGCKNGACGACRGMIVKGKVVQGAHSPSALSNDQRSQGMALFCCSTAQTDLIIEVDEVIAVTGIKPKRMPCRVEKLDRKTDDVIELKLKTAHDMRLQYLAGQYIEILLKDGNRRSYSMASPPHLNGPLELHIRWMPGGVLTDHVFGAMKERDLLRIEGPFGTFFLREDSDKPVIFFASGTGFAPIKAMIEHALFKELSRPISLYWGGRRKEDLYMMALAERWAREVPGFTFVPVLSEPGVNGSWLGRTGLVHRAVIEDLPDLSGYQVYACGAPVMVEAARRDFTLCHRLPTDEFFADSFTSSADVKNVV